MSVGIGIAAVVARAVELLELVLHGELRRVLGILLGDDAVERSVVFIRYGIGRVVGQNLPVGQTYGEVGIGIPRLVGLHAHQARNVETVTLVVERRPLAARL